MQRSSTAGHTAVESFFLECQNVYSLCHLNSRSWICVCSENLSCKNALCQKLSMGTENYDLGTLISMHVSSAQSSTLLLRMTVYFLSCEISTDWTQVTYSMTTPAVVLIHCGFVVCMMPLWLIFFFLIPQFSSELNLKSLGRVGSLN